MIEASQPCAAQRVCRSISSCNNEDVSKSAEAGDAPVSRTVSHRNQAGDTIKTALDQRGPEAQAVDQSRHRRFLARAKQSGSSMPTCSGEPRRSPRNGERSWSWTAHLADFGRCHPPDAMRSARWRPGDSRAGVRHVDRVDMLRPGGCTIGDDPRSKKWLGKTRSAYQPAGTRSRRVPHGQEPPLTPAQVTSVQPVRSRAPSIRAPARRPETRC